VIAAPLPAASFWPVLGLVAVAVLGGIAPARALPLDLWSDDDVIYVPSPPPEVTAPRRRVRPAHPRMDRAKQPVKPARKPQRPIIVTISLEKQSLKVYDANGLFAQAPVSTGMRGHATPLGVFSIIQKNKWHRSNIYSGAPMPYMQRLTWSGIALHAGALPGYPASHGCIRVPMNFAQDIWRWTGMGTRVVVTPGEISPISFSHPLLVAQRPKPPAPEIAATSQAQDGVSSDKPDPRTISATTVGLVSSAEQSPPIADLFELRPSLLPDSAKSALSSAVTPLERSTRLADAGPKLASPDAPAIASDSTLTGTVPAAEPVAAAAPPSPRRTGPIAVMISRKDGRLYVRQDFEPLFDIPVTIAASERPLGTHVFTAKVIPGDPDSFSWTALSLPAPAQKVGRHKRSSSAMEDPTGLVDGPAEALDRVTIPAETMMRIAEVLTTGSSIIVTDQGLAGSETGKGTDFIVPLR